MLGSKAARRALAGTGRLRRFLKDQNGLALTEFAFGLPFFIGIAMYGTEMANLAMTRMNVNQATLTLVDNASRLGQSENGDVAVRVTEKDVLTVFRGISVNNTSRSLLADGRVILSSLERNASGGQWIHWQRCIGTMNKASVYGGEGTGITGTSFPGMGPSGKEIKAPADEAIMFAEVTFKYKGLFGTLFVDNPVITNEAAHVIRDERLLTDGLQDDSGGTKATCDKLTAL